MLKRGKSGRKPFDTIGLLIENGLNKGERKDGRRKDC